MKHKHTYKQWSGKLQVYAIQKINNITQKHDIKRL